jgi:hypothetical protein
MRLYAEYDDPAPLVRAIHAARAWGDVRLDTYTPYYSPEIDRALATRPSRLGLVVFAGGIGAAATAYGLQWLLNGYLYPLNVGGRPPHFPLAFVPITFEMGVLFASFAAVISVFVGARLMRLWDPSRDVHGIESSTHTRFWLVAEPVGDHPDVAGLEQVLRQTSPHAVRMEVP